MWIGGLRILNRDFVDYAVDQNVSAAVIITGLFLASASVVAIALYDSVSLQFLDNVADISGDGAKTCLGAKTMLNKLLIGRGVRQGADFYVLLRLQAPFDPASCRALLCPILPCPYGSACLP